MAIKNDKFTPKVPPPMHLHICRESLNVASKHYSRVFGTSRSFPEVYFDFERDTLYFDWRGSFSLDDFSKEDLKRVKYLPVRLLNACC